MRIACLLLVDFLFCTREAKRPEKRTLNTQQRRSGIYLRMNFLSRARRADNTFFSTRKNSSSSDEYGFRCSKRFIKLFLLHESIRDTKLKVLLIEFITELIIVLSCYFCSHSSHSATKSTFPSLSHCLLLCALALALALDCLACLVSRLSSLSFH